MVIHQSNHGLSATRNVCLDRCHGDLIAFLDPDDAFCENMLSVMEKAMQTSGADIVECNYANYTGKFKMDPRKAKHRRVLRRPHEGIYTSANALRMLVRQAIATNIWWRLYTRKIWDEHRFREGQNFEDLGIILPLLNSARNICVLSDTLVMHRIHSGSISKTLSIRNLRDHDSITYNKFRKFKFIKK